MLDASLRQFVFSMLPWVVLVVVLSHGNTLIYPIPLLMVLVDGPEVDLVEIGIVEGEPLFVTPAMIYSPVTGSKIHDSIRS